MGDIVASLNTRAVRVSRLLKGLTIGEVVQVLDLALREVLKGELDLGSVISVTVEHEDTSQRDAPEAPPWLGKQVAPQTPNEAAVSDGMLFGRTVSFTGDLTSMSREDAAIAVANLGGVPQVNVTRRTDVLVVGNHPGEKLDRARRYSASAQPIEMIDEPTFRRYLTGVTFTSEGRDRIFPNVDLRAEKSSAQSKALSPSSRAPRLAGALQSPPKVMAQGLAMVELACQACGKVWERQPQRGRLPLICPECRAPGASI
ncbi:hypothetical protein QN367_09055 [Cryobacterium sp. RTS3]|uniref:BRCT domain-containing protein n=1 Tax=Cryobacterium sp. RTS3 TaxID=3048643 RepID=UPI002B239566|nr:hypothetical protein [Cryobacterium sp. RTS3]MEA9999246.1 hypothetical protein [Cryobacterium sp. RTS3]